MTKKMRAKVRRAMSIAHRGSTGELVWAPRQPDERRGQINTSTWGKSTEMMEGEGKGGQERERSFFLY
jgi:hypothetical protein